MSVSVDPLFTPFQTGQLKLRNRIVMAPMTRSRAPGGIPTADTATYYRRRAEGEVGLIISEGTVVDRPSARNEPHVPDFHGDEALARWSDVVKNVHAAGGLIGPQLWHVGAVRTANPADPTSKAWFPDGPIDSPSGLAGYGDPVAEPMTEEAIADTIAAFAKAASDAKRLGFDVIEVHAAHGYLIDQFFWSTTNTRTDRYGGATLPERSRFAVELIKAVRDAVGADMPLIIRVSQWKQQDYKAQVAANPDELLAWLAPIVDAGANIVHCSERRFWEAAFPVVDGPDGLNLAGWVKKLLGCTTIAVGSVGLSADLFSTMTTGEASQASSLENLMVRLDRGEFDLVAVGRALLADPDWAVKVQRGDRASLVGFSMESLGQYP